MGDSIERIMCSAVWVHDDRTFVHNTLGAEIGTVVFGYRHCNCFEMISKLYKKSELVKHGYTSGFLTTNNRFVNRTEAKIIAINANQLLEHVNNGDELYSEDVWLSGRYKPIGG